MDVHRNFYIKTKELTAMLEAHLMEIVSKNLKKHAQKHKLLKYGKEH